MGNVLESGSGRAEYPVREQITRRVSEHEEYIYSGFTSSDNHRGQLSNSAKALILVKKSKAVQNKCHINGHSIRYSPSLKRLTLEYDCIQDSVLNIYNTSSLKEEIIKTEKPLYSVQIPKSLNEQIQIDLKTGLQMNFVIEMKPKTQGKNFQNACETIQLTFCELDLGESNSGGDKVNIKRQCVLYKGKAFEVQNVFGLSNSAKETSSAPDNTGKSELCVICLTNHREAILLPCRHACLCSECSKTLFKNVQECPICRSNVYSVVKIESKE
ncbi:RING domain protein [Cryptosporidium felis]|nr:RING domain protein [Cryptosporidium felis]